jgi:hypothetical protein
LIITKNQALGINKTFYVIEDKSAHYAEFRLGILTVFYPLTTRDGDVNYLFKIKNYTVMHKYKRELII